jgi:hypothetical protein
MLKVLLDFHVFFGRILHCFTPVIDLGHILRAHSDSLEACFSILIQEIGMYDMLQMSHYTVHVMLYHRPRDS